MRSARPWHYNLVNVEPGASISPSLGRPAFLLATPRPANASAFVVAKLCGAGPPRKVCVAGPGFVTSSRLHSGPAPRPGPTPQRAGAWPKMARTVQRGGCGGGANGYEEGTVRGRHPTSRVPVPAAWPPPHILLGPPLPVSLGIVSAYNSGGPFSSVSSGL